MENEILQKILEELQKQSLLLKNFTSTELGNGIVVAPKRYPISVYIGAPDTGGGLWRCKQGDEFVAFTNPSHCLHVSLKGLETYYRRYDSKKFKDEWKLVLHCVSDRDQYAIESSATTVWSFSLVRSLLSMTDEQIRSPLYLVPMEGKEEEVVLCQIFDSNKALVYFEGGENLKFDNYQGKSWKEAWEVPTKTAILRVRSLLGIYTPIENRLKRDGQLTTQSNGKFVPNEDLSDLIAQTAVAMEARGWSVEDGKTYLQRKYGKPSRHLLTKLELQEFLRYLNGGVDDDF